MVSSISNGLYSLCIAFVYRYYVLLHSGSIRTIYLLLICILVACPSVFHAVILSTVDDNPEALKPLLASIFGYNLTNLVVSGHLSILRFWTMYAIIFACSSTVVAYSIMFLCRRRVLSALSTMDMSPKTKIVHRDLMMALTVQSLLPLVIVVCSMMYGAQQLNFVHSTTMEQLVLLITAFNPVLSPLFSLYFVRPYRDSILKWLNRPKLRKAHLLSISVAYSMK
ncbi:unnamed protein product, partial [Mesorhabditis belari]|uniref:G protein-coupled receptor n=1 Tax=Mesorhabditis belari TaxID=2138241 RepID=A0AAF3EXJ0_9BILA